MDTMMAAPAMVPASFFSSSDSKQDNFRHVMYPTAPTLASTPLYSRSSSSPQPLVRPRLVRSSQPFSRIPTSSPRSVANTPSILLETEPSDTEGYPATPPLSSSPSVISSPGSYDMLQTPLNPMFSGLDGCDMKQETTTNYLQGFTEFDWPRCTSPPMMPVYLPSQSQDTTKAFPPPLSDHLSTASCPSLSPSPSPYTRSVTPEKADFCDPRNLTVGTVNSTLAPEYTALPTLCAAAEDEKFNLEGDVFIPTPAPAIAPTISFQFDAALHHGLPNFDDFSDLESEDDFVNGLVNIGERPATETSRSRASSDALSLSQSSYGCGDDLEGFEEPEVFTFSSLPSPPQSCQDSNEHRDKRTKQACATEAAKPTMTNAATGPSSGSPEQQTPQRGDSGSDSKASSGTSGSENAASTALPAPTNRRGRKQSLTEDPSKTFVCELCNRRFRRQEHLKRHYRSLHTQEKPFECNECGKKFSRSDNLAQHARTHSSGGIVMNLVDDPDTVAAGSAGHHSYSHPAMPGGASGEDYHTYGKVLFQIAADIPGSASESSSDEGSTDQSKKKRKRAD